MSDCCHKDFAFRFLSFIFKNYLAYWQDKINYFALRWSLLEGVESEAIQARGIHVSGYLQHERT